MPVGLAAAQLGIQDMLVEEGLRPHMAGGEPGRDDRLLRRRSLCRCELMGLLMRGELRPGTGVEAREPQREEALASACLGPDDDSTHLSEAVRASI
ncbi:hypothetical protein [Streptomyces marokkonensis]|uniref:hypothetical protein n=1 Tax=Streptomyces marokkonensis TaxID=324855 RepID=UPI0031F132CF